jgi:outer membrane protein, heavy metal efflux system
MTFSRAVTLRTELAILAMACAGSSAGADLTFAEALAIASADAPALHANAAQVEAAKQAAIPADSLPDPKLLLGIDNLPVDGPGAFTFDYDFMTAQRVGVLQEFPNSRKRAARVAGAQGRIGVAEAQGGLLRLIALRQTAIAWIARDAAERQLTQIDALVAENQLFESAIRARLVSGQGSPSDALAARQEAASIEERRDTLVAKREQAISELRQWIGSPAAESTLAGASPEWPIDREVLLHGLQAHPELVLLDAQKKMLDADVAQAQATTRPDWSLELAYLNSTGPHSDMMSLEFTIDLPIRTGSRQDPLIASRRAERLAFDSDREALLRDHVQALESDLAEYHRLQKAVARERDVLLPLTEEKVQLALAAWRGGKASLADVAAARSERIDARMQLIALRGEAQQMAARLHFTYSEALGEQQ